MRIFILEDSPERMAWFKTRFWGEAVDSTDDPNVAIELLTKNTYDRIYLDHDILESHYGRDTDCDKTTGLRVAKWLGENPKNNPKAVITIHSRNNNGADRMKKALELGNRLVSIHPFHIMIVS